MIADDELRLAFARDACPAYGTLLEVIGRFQMRPTWYHPDTGELLGEIGYIASMTSDGTQEATSAVAVSCLQWSFDLLGVPARVEAREPL